MKKRKILFIISNLESGGVSKSITSLMNVIDREKYDVSLMVLSFTGPFINLLPENIRIITNPVWQAVTGHWTGFKYLLKKNPLLAMGHAVRMLLSRFSKAKAGELLAKLMPALDEEFDCIVDFNGQHQLYYMVNKLKAKKKITFFHNDYSKWPYYFKSDKKFFKEVTAIFTVSDHCVEILKEWFPEQSSKINLFENITPISLIEDLSNQQTEKEFSKINSILTVGHVCERKGSSLALQAAKKLKEDNIQFHWYFLGSIENKPFYSDIIRELGIEENITFLGIDINPYRYMKNATIIVHPSKFEGKSIALDEAKLLSKPIVVTNFSTVNDQFTDGVNATICNMDPDSLEGAITELLSNSSLREKYINELNSSKKDNSSEILKLYKIFDS